MARKRITAVRVISLVDDCPDFSTLGEYTDQADDWVIVRRDGDYLANLRAADDDYELPERGREFRFFLPYAGGETQGTDDYQKYGLQDYERCESYNNDNWSYLGIRAVADVVLSGGQCLTVETPGLWGVESDSDRSYFDEVGKEELTQLRSMLVDLGFSEAQADKAIASAETKLDHV
jgi:hypothetical protein